MTWGSNASYDTHPCAYCGETVTDNTDEPMDNVHWLTCKKIPLSKLLLVGVRRTGQRLLLTTEERSDG